MSLLQFAIHAALVGAALSSIMALAWAIQQKTGNSGWVDTTWTFGTGFVGTLAALAPLGSAPWPHWRQITVAIIAACWCGRLGLHIAERTRSIKDDPRYLKLAIEWGDDAPRRMFWFLQSQAAVGFVLAMSISIAAHNPAPHLRFQDIIGIALLSVAILGEAIADRQLRNFSSRPANRNGICDVGLWRWSRHPNYFFEWLAWVAYPIIAIDFSGHNPYGWFALLAPASMYWVLVHVSGIPPLEEHMLMTRGDRFRAYQKRTRAFFPVPRF